VADGDRPQREPGVAAEVKRVPGSIGYLSLHHAREAGLQVARVPNRAGEAVEASPASASAAAAGLMSEGATGEMLWALTNAQGKAAYPICGVVWAVFPDKLPPQRRQAVISFLRWVVHDGQESVAQLHYARLPKRLVEHAEKELGRESGKRRPLARSCEPRLNGQPHPDRE
jgi:phosphate transport system substrate-binding protein